MPILDGILPYLAKTAAVAIRLDFDINSRPAIDGTMCDIGVVEFRAGNCMGDEETAYQLLHLLSHLNGACLYWLEVDDTNAAIPFHAISLPSSWAPNSRRRLSDRSGCMRKEAVYRQAALRRPDEECWKLCVHSAK